MSTSSIIKCVITGDDKSGKQCLLRRIMGEQFEDTYSGPYYNCDTREIDTGDSTIELRLIIINEHEGSYRQRIPLYETADVIIHCRSVISKVPLEDWTTEFRHLCRKVPIILVLTKFDLKQDVILDDDFKKENIMKKLGVSAQAECSAVTGEGIDKVIELIVTSANDSKLKSKSKRIGSKCSIS